MSTTEPEQEMEAHHGAGHGSRSAAATAEPQSSEGKQLPQLLKKNVTRLPFLGHALSLKSKPVELLMEGRRQFGDMFALNLAGQMTAVFSGPRANEAFFRASDEQFSAREAYQMMVPVFGKGVVYDSPPEIMDEQLGFVYPALRDSRMRTYCNYFDEECERYFASWGREGTADIYTTTNELTVFIASRCLLGRDFRDNMSAHFAKLYHDLQGGINLIAFFAPSLPIPAFRKRDKARAEIVRLCSQITAERRRTGAVEEDFIQTLMSARYKKQDRPLTDDEITGLILALLFGGQHTSAVMTAWANIELLRHPHLRAPLIEEQDQVMAGKKLMTMEDIRAMHKLERLLIETERMHPPLIMLMRKVMRDFHFDDYVVPKGWMAMVSPALSHRVPEVFKNPDQFDPDRFAPPRDERKQATYTLIGFGGGKHRCIGMAFAYLQIRAIMSYMLRNFELEMVSRDPAPDYSGFVVGPEQPCLVRYRRRSPLQVSVPGSKDAHSTAAAASSPA